MLYTNKNIIMSSFESSRGIQTKEGGPDKVSSKLTQSFLEKRFLKCFNQIKECQPSWSCDQRFVDKFSFPCSFKLKD